MIDTSVIARVVFSEMQASSLDEERASAYEEFLSRSRRDGVQLCWSPLSFSELASVVERYHLRRYQRDVDANIERKRFRGIAEQRERVTRDLVHAWGYVRQLGLPMNSVIDEASADAVLTLLTTTRLDGYDALLVTSMKASGVPYIVSDDADYASAPNVIVFSANEAITT